MEKRHQFGLALLMGLIMISTACNLMRPAEQGVNLPTSILAATEIPPTYPFPTPTEVKIEGTIRLWHSWSETERVSLVQIIDGFHEIYPDVYFDVLYVPAEDIQARYQVETREGSGPTLLLGPAEWGPALFDSALIQDLEGALPDPLVDRLNKPALEASLYKGTLVGLPYAVQGIVLYRNTDIATLSPKSLDELIMLAQTSTQGEEVGAVLERSFFYSGAHLNGIGGQWMDSEGMPIFNNEKGLAWIELLRSFEQAGPTNYLTDQDLEYFKQGRVGWIIDGTWNMQNLVEAIGAENLAIDPWPTCESGRLSGYVLPEEIYLSSLAQESNRQAAIKFIEYLLSPPAQNNLTSVGRIPAISDIQLTEAESSPLITQAMVALAGGTAYPILPVITSYNLNLDIALRAIFEENVPSVQALQQAEEAILNAIQQSQVTSTP
jgi:arabinogalactan oligomer / maltooligosaccharide transport system substrate-binding protein